MKNTLEKDTNLMVEQQCLLNECMSGNNIDKLPELLKQLKAKAFEKMSIEVGRLLARCSSLDELIVPQLAILQQHRGADHVNSARSASNAIVGQFRPEMENLQINRIKAENQERVIERKHGKIEDLCIDGFNVLISFLLLFFCIEVLASGWSLGLNDKLGWIGGILIAVIISGLSIAMSYGFSGIVRLILPEKNKSDIGKTKPIWIDVIRQCVALLSLAVYIFLISCYHMIVAWQGYISNLQEPLSSVDGTELTAVDMFVQFGFIMNQPMPYLLAITGVFFALTAMYAGFHSRDAKRVGMIRSAQKNALISGKLVSETTTAIHEAVSNSYQQHEDVIREERSKQILALEVLSSVRSEMDSLCDSYHKLPDKIQQELTLAANSLISGYEHMVSDDFNRGNMDLDIEFIMMEEKLPLLNLISFEQSKSYTDDISQVLKNIELSAKQSLADMRLSKSNDLTNIQSFVESCLPSNVQKSDKLIKSQKAIDESDSDKLMPRFSLA